MYAKCPPWAGAVPETGICEKGQRPCSHGACGLAETPEIPSVLPPALPFLPAFAPLHLFNSLPTLLNHELLSELKLCPIHFKAVVFSWTHTHT